MRDGDCFSSFKLEESERILRRNRYLRDVRIYCRKMKLKIILIT